MNNIIPNTSTHAIVVNEDGSYVRKNHMFLFQSLEDGSNIYVPLTQKIQEDFKITDIVEDNNAHDILPNGDISSISSQSQNLSDFTWHHKNILLFLDEYKKRISKFRNPKFKKRILWEEISKEMEKFGYMVDANALDRKMRNMKNTYRTILDNNNKKKSTGKGRINWEYFTNFEEIFKDDRTVNSPLVISSTLNAAQEPDNTLSITSFHPLSDDLFLEDARHGNPNSYASSCSDTSIQSCSRTSTPLDTRKLSVKRLDMYRKRQLEIEEEKLNELKKIRESIDQSNKIQIEKNEILKNLLLSSTK